MNEPANPPRDGEVAARSADGGAVRSTGFAGPSTPDLRSAVPLPVPGRKDWLYVDRSDAALILCFPHGGTDLPAPFDAGLVSRDLAVKDCDWHIRQLYDGLGDATRISTEVSRTVIDVNRDPSGESLYPGQATTELCPTTTFDGEPLYLADVTIDTEARRAAYFDAYHAAIATEIARLRGRHSEIVMFDCHSIRSVVPRLFDGELPEFNVGTDNGVTCAPALQDAVVAQCVASRRSHVVNGRFRGGWTTRHYAHPGDGVHAIQLEIAQRAYLDETQPDQWNGAIAGRLRSTLARILQACVDFAK